MPFRFAIALGILVSGCGAAASLPPDATILPGDQRAAVLRQCSRDAPAAGEASWQPGEADIAALEAALPAALRAQPQTRRTDSPAYDWSRAPEGWHRQYVGIVRGGRRFVYGNFYPLRLYGDDPISTWRTRPVLICDGGSVFFGVEYDVEARRFTHLAFNGAI